MDLNELDRIPEDLIILSGSSLADRRHMPVPPNFRTAIRRPEQPRHLYEILREEYPAGHRLQILGKTGSAEISLEDLDTDSGLFRDAEYLVIPPLPERCAIESFQNTVAALRGPHGCPWDKKQTHRSLRDDLLQEVYELLDGLDRGDNEVIVEELGDVLLHILLKAQIGVDNGEFTMSDVVRHVNDKIISRHEHVFGKPEDLSPDQIMVRWEQIKQKERAGKKSKGGLLDGISRAMPALSMAFSYQKRAAKAGFEWRDADEIWDKLAEEMEEFVTAETPEEKEEELGDILFCVVSIARWYKVDPESALRMANLKFQDRVRYIEQYARETGRDMFAMSAEEKEQCWNEYKEALKNE